MRIRIPAQYEGLTDEQCLQVYRDSLLGPEEKWPKNLPQASGFYARLAPEEECEVLAVICNEHYVYLSFNGEPWGSLYLCGEFEILDSHLSRHWVLPNHLKGEIHFDRKLLQPFDRLVPPELLDVKNSIVSCPETDEDCELMHSVDRKYGEALMLEFNSVGVTKAANQLEGLWVQCPECADAWEAEPLDELTRCPSCRTLLKNPLLK